MMNDYFINNYYDEGGNASSFAGTCLKTVIGSRILRRVSRETRTNTGVGMTPSYTASFRKLLNRLSGTHARLNLLEEFGTRQTIEHPTVTAILFQEHPRIATSQLEWLSVGMEAEVGVGWSGGWGPDFP